jgi:hypothetical protein
MLNFNTLWPKRSNYSLKSNLGHWILINDFIHKIILSDPLETPILVDRTGAFIELSIVETIACSPNKAFA